jgi:predicted ABC-class ATPase
VLDELAGGRTGALATRDWLARQVSYAIAAITFRGEEKSRCPIAIDAGGQAVLERSAVVLGADFLEARLEIDLPALGRRVLGRDAEWLLCDALPEIVRRGLRPDAAGAEEVRAFVACVENQEHIRSQLPGLGLVAFVGDGAILPRESGASDRPLARERARPFVSPASLAVEVELLHPSAPGGSGHLRGLGVREGVSLVVGGGYHGKSTLLRALERCVHPHVPGDGRERVVSRADLVTVRAEDGRSITRVDVSAFISDLPSPCAAGAAPDPRAFTTADASGSTSQAAAIAEALEAGARGLLLDEDTCATNFMVRDARMQELVPPSCEPITPFVDRVRELWERHGVSTVLVMGGCGDYFEAADHVILLRDYEALDVTAEAHRIAAADSGRRRRAESGPCEAPRPRTLLARGLDPSSGRRRARISARGREELVYGQRCVDLRQLCQLVDSSQTRAIGLALQLASQRLVGSGCSLAELLDALEALLDEQGLDVLDPFGRQGEHPGRLARPRRFEIAAALGRLRGLPVAGAPTGSRTT